jgi:predicted PurR-regulated permease PerM
MDFLKVPACQRACAALAMLVCLGLMLILHLVPALISGLLAYVLTTQLLGLLRTRRLLRSILSYETAAGIVVGVVSVGLLCGLSVALASVLDGESLSAMMLKLADTLQQLRRLLPDSIAQSVPDSVFSLRELLVRFFKTHADELTSMGSHAAHSLFLVLVGWLIGVLVAVRGRVVAQALPPFEQKWRDLWYSFSQIFRAVMFAQSRIALINAVMTGIFLLCVMPLLGWHLPYAKTLVLLTFLCGLLPVIGNLISNTLIVVLALSVAFYAAVTALSFLIIAHKFEYFLSARIQGEAIGVKVWQLLVILFASEILFGPAGMVLAPVLYAFAMDQIRSQGWVR